MHPAELHVPQPQLAQAHQPPDPLARPVLVAADHGEAGEVGVLGAVVAPLAGEDRGGARLASDLDPGVDVGLAAREVRQELAAAVAGQHVVQNPAEDNDMVGLHGLPERERLGRLLVGLGIPTLSMSAAQLPRVKGLIRALRAADMRALCAIHI